jgi:uncharacterized membrane protein YgdD (TMEM256/DUF423 family)
VSPNSDSQTGGAPTGALFGVLACAGLAGAAGVALSAIAAHKIDSPALATAATILMIHAAAVMGLLSVAHHKQSGRRWLIIAGLMLCSAVLFSGAVSFHALTGNHIFPKAAPIGGSSLIASWLGVAVLALIEARKGR